MVLPSESTLRSAAPSIDPNELGPITAQAIVLVGGTVVDLAPARIQRADVVIQGPFIMQVGGAIDERLPRVDVSGCIVTPAFTIAHTHLYMALSCGMPPPPEAPRSLTDHLQSIWWPLDKALDDDLVHTSALAAAAVAAKAGAATLIDLHSSPRSIDGSLDRVEAALDEIGIRGVLAYETSDREGRGRRDAALSENRRFLRKVREGNTHHRALVGAHAMMSLNEDTLDELRQLATEFGVGYHLHVAEDATDALDAERNKRTQLAQRIERLAIQKTSVIVALEIAADTVAALATAGAFIVTNPRSNMRRGLRLLPYTGPHVALGTDGLDGDMLAEARTYALQHDAARDGLAVDTPSRIVASQILANRIFADLPARVLPGTRADLTILDYDPVTPMTSSNLGDHVVREWASRHVRHTIAGGRFIVRDGKLTTIDERELHLRTRSAAGRLWERMM